MLTKANIAGFTLIEILVVIVIMSIVYSVATLTIHFNRNKQLETVALTLANQIRLAEEEAMLRPAVLGLKMNSNHFLFYVYQTKNNLWKLLNNKVFHTQSLPENTQVVLKIDDKTIPEDDKLHLIISSNGETPSFSISFSYSDQKPLYQVIGEANGNVYVK